MFVLRRLSGCFLIIPKIQNLAPSSWQQRAEFSFKKNSKKAVNRAAEHLYEWEEWPLASNKNEKFVEFVFVLGGSCCFFSGRWIELPLSRADLTGRQRSRWMERWNVVASFAGESRPICRRLVISSFPLSSSVALLFGVSAFVLFTPLDSDECNGMLCDCGCLEFKYVSRLRQYLRNDLDRTLSVQTAPLIRRVITSSFLFKFNIQIHHSIALEIL